MAKIYKSPLDLGNELLKTYDQDLLNQHYANFVSNHPEIVRNGLEPVGNTNRKGWKIYERSDRHRILKESWS